MIVTRVSDSQDMGAEVVAQLFSNPRALMVTGFLIGVMGLVPGMPHLIFLSLAAGLGALGYMRMLDNQVEVLAPEPAPVEKTAESRELNWDDVAVDVTATVATFPTVVAAETLVAFFSIYSQILCHLPHEVIAAQAPTKAST